VDVPPAPRLSAAALEHLRETCVRQAALLRQPQLGAIGVRVAAAGPQVAVEPPESRRSDGSPASSAAS
jgi:hypothetical protein